MQLSLLGRYHAAPQGGERERRQALPPSARRSVILLGDAEAHPPRPGEVIYRDDVGTIRQRWNWREANRTKLTAATRDALLVL